MKKHKKKKGNKQAQEPLLLTEPTGEDVAVAEIAAPAAENGRAQKRLERRRVVNEDLQLELRTLRESVSEMLDRYKLKLDAELVQLVEATNGNGSLDGAGRRLPIAVAEEMIEQIRKLEIKAAKGRAKDFQRVQELVGNLIEQLPSGK